MTEHIFVDVGLYLLAVTALVIVYKILLIVAIYTIKQLAKANIKQSQILKIDNDEELDRLINEIKAKVAKHENI